MKFKNVREAIDCVIDKCNGIDYSDEKFGKVTKYLSQLPQNPADIEPIGKYYGYDFGTMFIVKDYGQGWFSVIHAYSKDGKIYITKHDGDMMDSNKHRVQSNEEAFQVMEEWRNVKFPYEIDNYYEMSDDHRYVLEMYEMQRTATAKREELQARLN